MQAQLIIHPVAANVCVFVALAKKKPFKGAFSPRFFTTHIEHDRGG